MSRNTPPAKATARKPSGAEDIAGGLELRLDPNAPAGDAAPPLARLLRRLRDRARAEQTAQATEEPRRAV